MEGLAPLQREKAGGSREDRQDHRDQDRLPKRRGPPSLTGLWLHITSARFDEPRALALVEFRNRHRGEPSNAPTAATINPSGWGGLHERLRDAIGAALERSGIKTSTDHHMQGKAPANICNRGRLRAGVQLELPMSLRNAFLSDPFARQAFAYAVRDTIVKGKGFQISNIFATSNFVPQYESTKPGGTGPCRGFHRQRHAGQHRLPPRRRRRTAAPNAGGGMARESAGALCQPRSFISRDEGSSVSTAFFRRASNSAAVLRAPSSGEKNSRRL